MQARRAEVGGGCLGKQGQEGQGQFSWGKGSAGARHTEHRSATWPSGSESSRVPSLPFLLLHLPQQRQPQLSEPGEAPYCCTSSSTLDGHLLFSFPVATVTNCRRLSGLKQHALIPFQFWRREV